MKRKRTNCDELGLFQEIIASHLLLLNFQDPSTDIRLFLNSRGGSFRADVSTIALGTTEGTASIILGGGTKGKTEKRVEKDIVRDRYMSSVETLKYGIIDGVIDREKILPVVPLPRKIRATRALEFEKDPIKFLNPDVPDDEIF